MEYLFIDKQFPLLPLEGYTVSSGFYVTVNNRDNEKVEETLAPIIVSDYVMR